MQSAERCPDCGRLNCICDDVEAQDAQFDADELGIDPEDEEDDDDDGD